MAFDKARDLLQVDLVRFQNELPALLLVKLFPEPENVSLSCLFKTFLDA
jgi:hypothetical protein